MSETKPDFDGLYRLETESTRRKFLSAFATASFGIAGLRNATERAFGEKPDGVPLIWRYDRFGNPETVWYISKERYRRIQVYHELPPNVIYEKTEGVNGIKLTQQSAEPTDLALKILVDKNTRSVRRDLPNRIQKIPVVVEERQTNPKPALCDRRLLNFYDPLPANPEIAGVYSDGSLSGEGTLGIVCYNDNPTTPTNVISQLHMSRGREATKPRTSSMRGKTIVGTPAQKRLENMLPIVRWAIQAWTFPSIDIVPVQRTQTFEGMPTTIWDI